MKSFYYKAILKSTSALIKTEDRLSNTLYSWAYKKELRSRLSKDYGHLIVFNAFFNKLWDQYTRFQPTKVNPTLLELLMLLNFKFTATNSVSTMCGVQQATSPVMPVTNKEHRYGKSINDSVEASSRLLFTRASSELVVDENTIDALARDIDREFISEFKTMLHKASPHYKLEITQDNKSGSGIADKINMVADEILAATGVRGNVAWVSPTHLSMMMSDSGSWYNPSGKSTSEAFPHVGMITDPFDRTKNITVYCDTTQYDDTTNLAEWIEFSSDSIFVGYKNSDTDSGILFVPYMILSYGHMVDAVTRENVMGLMTRYRWWAGKDADRVNYYGVIDVLPITEDVKPEYESEELLSDIVDKLNDHLPNHLPDNAKQKLVNSVMKEYGTTKYDEKLGIYDLQLRGVSIINNIGTSHLLGCNDVVIPPLLNEYRELRDVLTILNNEYKRLNKFQDLREFIPKFKLSEIKTALFNDLRQLTENYDIDCDVKLLMKEYTQ
jgi:hypothetical protein